jgi:hypothetical protein
MESMTVKDAIERVNPKPNGKRFEAKACIRDLNHDVFN